MKEQPTDYSRPVAYDTNGQPLYAHPPVIDDEESNKKDVTCDNNPKIVSDSARIKHIQSQKVFPGLNLSEGDYVISSVRRHPIGLLAPFAVGTLAIAIVLIGLFNYDIVVNLFQITGSMASQSTIFWPVIIFIIFVLACEYMAYYIYSSNRFFLTNESIIQQIQTGLFSKSEHIISLGNIEDASYTQNGLIQQLLDYGPIRLSTVGDETTYGFEYAVNPKDVVLMLSGALEEYKNCQVVDVQENK